MTAAHQGQARESNPCHGVQRQVDVEFLQQNTLSQPAALRQQAQALAVRAGPAQADQGFGQCDGVCIGSTTQQAVCEECATRRKQCKQQKRHWRVTNRTSANMRRAGFP